MTCPNCDRPLIEGIDDLDGVRITVLFCENCNFRHQACPQCRHEVERRNMPVPGDGVAPAIVCTECRWHQFVLEPAGPSGTGRSDGGGRGGSGGVEPVSGVRGRGEAKVAAISSVRTAANRRCWATSLIRACPAPALQAGAALAQPERNTPILFSGRFSQTPADW